MASKHTISARISPYTFQRLARDAEKEIQRVTKFSDRLGKALADHVATKAQDNFANAKYDGVNDVVVSARQTKKGNYSVAATGEAVTFIEYGAGVYFADQAYPGDIPSRYGGIGSYGNGWGERKGWHFKLRPGVQFTTGEGSAQSNLNYLRYRLQYEKTGELYGWSELMPRSPHRWSSDNDGDPALSEAAYLNRQAKKGGTSRVKTTAMRYQQPSSAYAFTRGNPANACMYNAYQDSLKDFDKIVEEVEGD